MSLLVHAWDFGRHNRHCRSPHNHRPSPPCPASYSARPLPLSHPHPRPTPSPPLQPPPILTTSSSFLQAVNLEGCRSPDGVTNDALRALCENLACSLSRLNVSHCSALTDEFLLSFARNAIAIEALNADGIPWISGVSAQCACVN